MQAAFRFFPHPPFRICYLARTCSILSKCDVSPRCTFPSVRRVFLSSLDHYYEPFSDDRVYLLPFSWLSAFVAGVLQDSKQQSIPQSLVRSYPICLVSVGLTISAGRTLRARSQSPLCLAKSREIIYIRQLSTSTRAFCNSKCSCFISQLQGRS